MELREISTQYNLMGQKFNTWLTHFHSTIEDIHKQGEIDPTPSDQNHLLKQEILVLKGQVEKLQIQLKTPSAENNHITPTAEKPVTSTDPFLLSKIQAELSILKEQNTTLENHTQKL